MWAGCMRILALLLSGLAAVDGFSPPVRVTQGSLGKRAVTTTLGMSTPGAAGGPKMPWQRISSPVYSIASVGTDGKKTMNIATYVSAASLPREGKDLIYSVALFKTSLTYEHVKQTGRLLLQLLSKEQADLVDLLGKQSGRDVEKLVALEKKGCRIEYLDGAPYLAASLGVCELEIQGWMDADDHELSLCKVVRTVNTREGEVLYTDFLRERGILKKQ